MKYDVLQVDRICLIMVMSTIVGFCVKKAHVTIFIFVACLPLPIHIVV